MIGPYPDGAPALFEVRVPGRAGLDDADQASVAYAGGKPDLTVS